MLDANDTRSLALLYHLNSEPSLNEESFEEGHDEVGKAGSFGERVALPEEGAVSGLSELLRRRSSCRAFAATPLALLDLAAILRWTYGPSRPVLLGDGLELQARSAPSAGALYPLELYVMLRAVQGLEDGLYHYDPDDHALESLSTSVDRGVLIESFVSPFFLDDANAIVFFTAVFDRTLHKYGARGYRYILFEAGHAAHNLCLLATERGLASLCVGGFVDAAVNRLLGLDVRTEGAVYCVGVGQPRSDPEPATAERSS